MIPVVPGRTERGLKEVSQAIHGARQSIQGGSRDLFRLVVKFLEQNLEGAGQMRDLGKPGNAGGTCHVMHDELQLLQVVGRIRVTTDLDQRMQPVA